jgi:hypothetical protein
MPIIEKLKNCIVKYILLLIIMVYYFIHVISILLIEFNNWIKDLI